MFFFLFQWLRASFYRKEKLLKEFYEFNENETLDDLNSKNDKISNSSTNSSQTRNWPKKLQLKVDYNKPILLVSSWIIGVFSCLYFFIWYRWIVVVMIISCIAVRAFNGFDTVELSLHGDMIIRELFCKNESSNSSCSNNNDDHDDIDDNNSKNSIHNQIDNSNKNYNNNNNNNINDNNDNNDRKESDSNSNGRTSIDTYENILLTERGKQKNKL